MSAPVLLTERLRLDGHRPADLDPLAALWQLPAVYGGIGGKPREREDVWLRLLRSIGQWTAFGYGAWVVRDRATGEVIGDVGLLEARRAIEPALDAPEMGWLIAPARHGQGLAGEAVAAALAWADAQGIGRTTCIIDPGNAASIRVARRVGYEPLPPRDYRGQPINIYARQAR